CINDALCLNTTAGKLFLKYNDAKRFPGMFEAEAKGLSLLRAVNALYVPALIATGDSGGTSFLILEWIDSGKRQKYFWEDFGSKFARLHQHSSENFGLDHDNYIGSLPQSNRQHKTWIEFFIEERLGKQIAIAINSGAISPAMVKQFDNLFRKVPEIIPEEKPSLLHGDLWNGNFMTAHDGSACLID